MWKHKYVSMNNSNMERRRKTTPCWRVAFKNSEGSDVTEFDSTRITCTWSKWKVTGSAYCVPFFPTFLCSFISLFLSASSLFYTDVSFEAFTAVMFQVKVLWVVTPCCVVVGYHRFRGLCCLHLQGEDLKLEAAWTSETMVSLHGVTNQKTPTSSTFVSLTLFLSSCPCFSFRVKWYENFTSQVTIILSRYRYRMEIFGSVLLPGYFPFS
jgi:hypothetical protein